MGKRLFVLLLLLSYTCSSQSFFQQNNGPFSGRIYSIATGLEGYLFATTSGSYVYSLDNGSIWKTGSQLSGPRSIIANSRGIMYSGNDAGQIFKSTDKGANWNQYHAMYGPVNTLSFDSAGHLFAGAELHGIEMINIDSTYGWMPTGSIPGHVKTIFTDKLGNVFAGTDSGGFCLSQNSLDWLKISLSNICVNSFASESSGSIIAGTDSGVFRSTNGGKDWIHIGLSGEIVNAIYANSMGLMLAGTNTGLFCSKNFGNNWNRVNLPCGVVNSIAVNTANDIFIGTYSGIFRSSDAGDNWLQLGNGLAKSVIWALLVKDSSTIYAGTDRWGLFRSTDHGKSWFFNSLPTTTVTALEQNKQGHLFCGTNNGIYRSLDNGLNWVQTGFPGKSISDIIINSEGIIFTIIWNQGVFSSSDNGLTWQAKNAGLTSFYTYTIFLHSSGKLYMGSGPYIYNSSDNGEHWSEYNIPVGQVQSFGQNSNGTLFAVTDGSGGFRSTDNGLTWVKITNNLPDNQIMSLVINLKDEIFIGTNQGNIFMSSNKGDTWILKDTKCHARCLAIDSDGYIIAGTMGSGVFRSMSSTLDIVSSAVPELSFQLNQNYPNPFNSNTVISFSLQKSQPVELKVFNILGQDVATLADAVMPKGQHKLTFDASALPGGVYFYRLKTGNFSHTRKFIYLK